MLYQARLPGRTVNIGERGIELIKSYEKMELQAYLPTPNDVWTIGYGHTKGVVAGMEITEQQADEFLLEDLNDAQRCVNRAIQGIQVTQGQYDAMVSLCFNIGCGAFSGSSVLRRLLDGDDEGASNAFGLWNKQKDKKTGGMRVLDGLTRRRAEEAELFRA
jgi:lysozyme